MPVLLPDDRPIRVKPSDPGGLKIAGVEAGVYGSGEADDQPRLAPAPEAPNPSALRAPPEPPRAIEGTTQPVSPPGGTTTSRTAQPASGAAAAASAPRAEPAKPPAKPQATTAPTATTARPPATVPASVTPAIAPAAAAKSAAPTGRFAVQLAAVRSEASAQAEWQALRLRHPDLFGARQPVFSKIDRDGKTFWRVRTGGFGDLAEARGFCDRVRAKGAACAVAEF